MYSIGFVGTGHIAAPMARFLARKGHRIVVSERNAETAQALADQVGAEIADNQTVLDTSDIVFLCLRPQIAGAVLEPLAFRADHRIVSVMAGVSLSRLAELCAPATDMTLTIPLGFLEQGGCPLPACPEPGLLAELFAPENPVIGVADEAGLNAHFAICAMVPGVLDLLDCAGSWLADITGDRDGAMTYSARLLGGFLGALDDRAVRAVGEERDALATQGTLSLQMVEALRAGGVNDTLETTLNAIRARLEG